MIATEWILGDNEQDLTEVRAIRKKVFCEEQQVPSDIEADGMDSLAVHLLVYYNNLPAATGRIWIKNDKFTLGRIAVLKEFRGKRLGDLVVRLLIRKAFDTGGKQQWVHAQVPVQGFYEKLGFIPCGDIYEEAGIPHITMVHEGDIFGKCQN